MKLLTCSNDMGLFSIKDLLAQAKVNVIAMVLYYFGIFSAVVDRSPLDVDSYIDTEWPIAKAGLLANIGPSGAKSSGAHAGVVIASPSTEDPNYLYAWIRDSSHTISEDSAHYESEWLNNHRGLGEPKFNIDETAFTGSWGRPQRDGPAVRSTALITYANWLLDHNNASYVKSTLWPIISLDLGYVSTYWNQSTLDLWEEVSSSSFFTTAVQHRSLRQGAALGTRIGEIGVVDEWNAQANNLLCFLQSYWNPDGKYITSNTAAGRSGKDSNSNLASIYTFDPEAGCDAVTFQPCSDKALASLKTYVDAFRPIYAINDGFSANSSVATGRYPEDVYYNGNPWYLTTFGVAEQLYDALIVWSDQGFLEVTDISLSFFQQFFDSIEPGLYDSSSERFKVLTSAIKKFADGFIEINAEYTPKNGGLSEQYNKDDGTPLSAVDLTWSYTFAITAFMARNGTAPESRGANGSIVPPVCHGNTGPQVPVTFKVTAYTVWSSRNIYLSGSVDALKNWSTSDALSLYPTEYPIWSITVNLPANLKIQYKYIRKCNGDVTWESDPNNKYWTPAGGPSTVEDTWR